MRLLSLLCLIPLIVSVQGQTFCEKYTTALFKNNTAQNQYKLIEAVVVRALLGCNTPATASFSNSTCGNNGVVRVVSLLDVESSNREFFDGSAVYTSVTGNQALNTATGIALANSIRFVNISGTGPSAVALNPAMLTLANHLIEWFGRDLGCLTNATDTSEDDGIRMYSGVQSMTAVHASMKINNTVWTGFATALVTALTSYGVTSTDITTIIAPYASTFLRGEGSAKVICNQPDCACAPGYSGANCTASATTAPPSTTTAPPSTTTSPPSGTSQPTTPSGGASSLSVSSFALFAFVAVAALL